METLKFYIVSFVFLGIFIGIGYFAYSRLDSGRDYVVIADQVVEREAPIFVPLSEPVPVETTPVIITEVIIPKASESEKPTSSSSEYNDLISRLEKLVTDVVVMTEGSRGTRVGTVQEFLNIYFETTNTIDNDYGPGTRERVREFQSEEGLPADGQSGPNTYNAMIKHLESL